METQVWSFFLIVALCSAVGYLLMKRYAAYHVNQKTKKLIEDFRREQGIETEDKAVADVEKDVLAADKAAAKSAQGKKTEEVTDKSGERDE